MALFKAVQKPVIRSIARGGRGISPCAAVRAKTPPCVGTVQVAPISGAG